ncbi:MAG: CocE/NonD family hydrolase [Thermomicrobiales bacterium]
MGFDAFSGKAAMSAEPRQTLHERFVANLTRETTDPWTKFETGIPMRDGIELAADVYLPKGQSGPFPTIVELTPYDKSGAFMIDDVGLFTRNGYAIVVVDLRGRGKSEGEWSPRSSMRQTATMRSSGLRCNPGAPAKSA